MVKVDELSRKTLEAAAHPRARAALGVGLVFYFFYHAAGFFARTWPFQMRLDAEQIYRLSNWVAAHGDYPARLWLDNLAIVFPYPPPTPLMFAGIGAAGPHGFLAIWLILIAAGFVCSLKAVFVGETTPIRRAWLLVAMIGMLIASSAVSWDLRYGNSNLIWLGAVMFGYINVGKRPILAGFFVGLSLALKLYSGLLIAWLLLYRPRAAVMAIAVTIGLWAILPAALFGPSGAVALYNGWLEQLRIVSDPWVYSAPPPLGQAIITVRRAAMVLAGAGPGAAETEWILRGFYAGWIGLVVWYGLRAWRAGVTATPSRAMLADWVVLLLFPLPFSPWLEPYHVVPMLPAAVLLVAVAFDRNVSARGRTVAMLGLAGALSLRTFFDHFAMRGLSLLLQFAFLVVALALLRREFIQPHADAHVT